MACLTSRHAAVNLLWAEGHNPVWMLVAHQQSHIMTVASHGQYVQDSQADLAWRRGPGVQGRFAAVREGIQHGRAACGTAVGLVGICVLM